MKDIDKGYKNFKKFFSQMGKSAEIGIFENKKDEEGQSIAEYAASNEFGAKITSDKAKGWLAHNMRQQGLSVGKITKDIVIPERSFMRSAYDENVNSVMKKLDKMIAKGLMTRDTYEHILRVAGEEMRNFIIVKIRNAKSWARPLHPFTVAKKGFDTILIESGNMWKAIDIRIK